VALASRRVKQLLPEQITLDIEIECDATRATLDQCVVHRTENNEQIARIQDRIALLAEVEQAPSTVVSNTEATTEQLFEQLRSRLAGVHTGAMEGVPNGPDLTTLFDVFRQATAAVTKLQASLDRDKD
jgi:hypothetical protein